MKIFFVDISFFFVVLVVFRFCFVSILFLVRVGCILSWLFLVEFYMILVGFSIIFCLVFKFRDIYFINDCYFCIEFLKFFKLRNILIDLLRKGIKF